MGDASADASAPPAIRPDSVREVVVRAPGSECAETCASTWKSCHDTCRAVACDECDKVYRSCVPACFHEEAGTSRPAASTRTIHLR
jgi:hypothetical protein